MIYFLGASSGIGAATAILFSELGASLSLFGRNLENLQKTADKCSEKSIVSSKPLVIPGNESY